MKTVLKIFDWLEREYDNRKKSRHRIRIAMNSIVELLESPDEEWVQGDFRMVNREHDVEIRNGNGILFMDIANPSMSLGFFDKVRLHRAIQVAQANSIIGRCVK